MEQQTDSKLGKEYVKAVYCHPAYLTYMKSQFSSVAQSCLTLWPPRAAADQVRHVNARLDKSQDGSLQL